MTYNFNKQQHSTKIKEGLERAKKNGKKLGRPSGKIKGEDDVLALYNKDNVIMESEGCITLDFDLIMITQKQIAERTGVSLSTVKRIIKKHKTNV